MPDPRTLVVAAVAGLLHTGAPAAVAHGECVYEERFYSRDGSIYVDATATCAETHSYYALTICLAHWNPPLPEYRFHSCSTSTFSGQSQSGRHDWTSTVRLSRCALTDGQASLTWWQVAVTYEAGGHPTVSRTNQQTPVSALCLV